MIETTFIIKYVVSSSHRIYLSRCVILVVNCKETNYCVILCFIINVVCVREILVLTRRYSWRNWGGGGVGIGTRLRPIENIIKCSDILRCFMALNIYRRKQCALLCIEKLKKKKQPFPQTHTHVRVFYIVFMMLIVCYYWRVRNSLTRFQLETLCFD